MRNPDNVLGSLKDHSKDKNYVYDRLYRNLYNREMFLNAYQNIYANIGNMTEGADGKTIDSMSIERIDRLIGSLKSEKYQPKPSRRVYIPKKNGDKRPLGIPSFEDKLVQEVIKMILEAIYEGSFERNSHGFRPNRSCHTALNQIKTTYTGAKWFIEGDIKGFFDNIDHKIMIGILSKRIQDSRFLRLIQKFLKAGYLEEWRFYNTYSGTPQGGIISPILSNIYLDQLDKFMSKLKLEFDKGDFKKIFPIAYEFEKQRGVLVKQLKRTDIEEERKDIINKIKDIDNKRLLYPHTEPFDEDYKRLQYVRYADDWICGVIGSKADAVMLKETIKEYLFNELKLELSDEKTLITHSQKHAKFLGYEIYVRRSSATKRNRNGVKCRHLNGSVGMLVSMDTIKKRLLSYGAMTIELTVHKKESWKPKARYYMKNNDDLEIFNQFNSEIRGFRNYYKIADNSSILNSFFYIMKFSMFKTLATKYRTSMRKCFNKYRIGKNFGVKYQNSQGKIKTCLLYNGGFARQSAEKKQIVDYIPKTAMYTSKTSLVARLKARECEICGSSDTAIEIHHIKKLKDLKGKTYWEKFMIARRRKTLALCKSCHEKLHKGLLD